MGAARTQYSTCLTPFVHFIPASAGRHPSLPHNRHRGGFTMGTSLFIFITTSLALCHGLNILDSCLDEPTGCPVNAVCKKFGCRNEVCICNVGYKPSPGGDQCLRVRNLGDPCGDVDSVCAAGSCVSNTCTCDIGTYASVSGTRCKPEPLAGRLYSVLGETCNGVDIVCLDALFQECGAQQQCVCRAGNKVTTYDILAALPSAGECVPDNLEIGISIDDANCAETPQRANVLVGDTCLLDTECTGNATCETVGCGKKCTCPPNTSATLDKTACKDVRYLGDDCDSGATVCATLHSICYNNKCACEGGYEDTGTGLCREESMAPGCTYTPLSTRPVGASRSARGDWFVVRRASVSARPTTEKPARTSVCSTVSILTASTVHFKSVLPTKSSMIYVYRSRWHHQVLWLHPLLQYHLVLDCRPVL
ncbi:fibrillin-1-like [Haliotis rubra]|uniref:fibrillin-1-like n=1 Tax=Haliotis rubra TaxID=36100 RepID=UPI001EE54D59|nr:fibrillin-1-like [Haliotis rubra]